MPDGQPKHADLERLARLHGVQTGYTSAFGQRVTAEADHLVATLHALGVDTADPDAAAAARVRALRGEFLAPVVVAWDGVLRAALRPGDRGGGRVECSITPEADAGAGAPSPTEWAVDLAALPATERRAAEGAPETVVTLAAPAPLPPGYHELRVAFGGDLHTAMVVSAPVRSFTFEDSQFDREWGLFCPMYALRTARSLGCGDLTDFRELAAFQASLGGKAIGTLPVLASYLDEPFDPSPYSPVSRLFWNELFIDPTAAPEFEGCEEAHARMGSEAFQRELGSINAVSVVQYRRAAALRRGLLEPLSERFHGAGGAETDEFRRFLAENPLAEDYARFRAVMERQRGDWAEWSDRLRAGEFKETDADPRAVRYHLYAQQLFLRQLGDFAGEMRGRHGLVYLDLPIGTREDGFDVFRYADQFARGTSVGAPPDTYFPSGQRWGFPPQTPDAMRSSRYEYMILSLRNHMRHADYLRLDHVMGAHRLFWIAPSLDAHTGVYVEYEAEHAYAILSLESHRNRCRLVGENLGTVPPAVDEALERHDMCPLYVAQYEAKPKAPPLPPVTPGSVASINTHDMPPLATFWSAEDVDERIVLGLFGREGRAEELETRATVRDRIVAFLEGKGLLEEDADLHEIRDAAHEYLADSDADFLMINIEDLWLETRFQNVPGTTDEYPNWRHRLRYELDHIRREPEVAALLERLDALRKSHRRSDAPGA